MAVHNINAGSFLNLEKISNDNKIENVSVTCSDFLEDYDQSTQELIFNCNDVSETIVTRNSYQHYDPPINEWVYSPRFTDQTKTYSTFKCKTFTDRHLHISGEEDKGAVLRKIKDNINFSNATLLDLYKQNCLQFKVLKITKRISVPQDQILTVAKQWYTEKIKNITSYGDEIYNSKSATGTYSTDANSQNLYNGDVSSSSFPKLLDVYHWTDINNGRTQREFIEKYYIPSIEQGKAFVILPSTNTYTNGDNDKIGGIAYTSQINENYSFLDNLRCLQNIFVGQKVSNYGSSVTAYSTGVPFCASDIYVEENKDHSFNLSFFILSETICVERTTKTGTDYKDVVSIYRNKLNIDNSFDTIQTIPYIDVSINCRIQALERSMYDVTARDLTSGYESKVKEAKVYTGITAYGYPLINFVAYSYKIDTTEHQFGIQTTNEVFKLPVSDFITSTTTNGNKDILQWIYNTIITVNKNPRKFIKLKYIGSEDIVCGDTLNITSLDGSESSNYLVVKVDCTANPYTKKEICAIEQIQNSEN